MYAEYKADFAAAEVFNGVYEVVEELPENDAIVLLADASIEYVEEINGDHVVILSQGCITLIEEP